MSKPPKNKDVATRNPDRTRERILTAALKEFAAKGFAGARVDAIARRAAINKRMLYHYFGDKEELFRAVLRRKISERQTWAADLPSDPTERLPFWFHAACKDPDWIRLLEWEALQGDDKKLIDEKERLASITEWLKRLGQRQERRELSSEFNPRHLALAMQSLTMYPIAFPQFTRLIMGQSADDPNFQNNYGEFLRKFATAFRPATVARATAKKTSNK